MRTYLVVGLALGLAGRAAAQGDPQAVIEKAVKAQGGAELLSKLKATQAKAKGTMTLPVMGVKFDFEEETYAQYPDQFKSVMSGTVNGRKFKRVEVQNGDKLTLTSNDKAMELSDDQRAAIKESAYFERVTRLLPLIQDKGYELAALPDAKVEDHDAAGVKVSAKGHKDVRLYFDKASGFLVKAERHVVNERTDKEMLEETLFSDYKEVNGIKSPMKAVIQQDGKKFKEMEFTERKNLDKLETSVFES